MGVAINASLIRWCSVYSLALPGAENGLTAKRFSKPVVVASVRRHAELRTARAGGGLHLAGGYVKLEFYFSKFGGAAAARSCCSRMFL